MEGNNISVVSHARRFKKLERGVWSAARFFLDALDAGSSGLEVFLVSNRRMRAINLRCRGRNVPTNVLAFEPPQNFPNPLRGAQKLGEIYLGPTYIKDHGEDLEYMLLHGILHLVGFNHEYKSDRIRMEKLEKKVLTFLREGGKR